MNRHIPTEITLHKQARQLELAFDDNQRFQLPCEFLRVYSPSAEVRGHGPGQERLQVGKEDVNIEKIEQVGTYAISITFDDGHDSGIYDWNLLYDYGVNYLKYWQAYLDKLEAAGHKRKVATAQT
ncbi:DUF971 domain-containing protein [Ectothiorhodospiraceae bacterium BW-2]|nr:DUF971 domain-containing protein [Ectothiorhodospiraceae bacterium BW-2]